MKPMHNHCADILCQKRMGKHGAIGLITLNRPAKLNAITPDMAKRMHDYLAQCKKDPEIKALMIRGAGDRAFSAGGDLCALYEKRNKLEEICAFFQTEYALNRAVYHFPKPYIALMHGIVMGGGVGLCVPGSYRIATTTLRLAMPEAKIGFFTDVGATYFLPRCRSHIGTYLGLTAHTIGAYDAHYAGLVDTIIPDHLQDALCNAICHMDWSYDPNQDIQNVLARFQQPAKESQMACYYPLIDSCFSHQTVEAVCDALGKQKDNWATSVQAAIQRRSPLSLKIILEALKRGEQLNFDACIGMEYTLASALAQEPDLYAGIRAALIDKDHKPAWQYPTLESVPLQRVIQYFA